ncbi:hypothetical protein [Burkholderia sp. L27(2015)]|nr:hypothetical protein [Burkholderia sp. L27(2015)]
MDDRTAKIIEPEDVASDLPTDFGAREDQTANYNEVLPYLWLAMAASY